MTEDEQRVENATRAREILSRHVEYMDGLSRGQVMMKTSNALAAVEEALAPTLALLDSIAEPAAALVDMMADEHNSVEVSTAWNRLRIALITNRAALTACSGQPPTTSGCE
jgi:hypothetical protein